MVQSLACFVVQTSLLLFWSFNLIKLDQTGTNLIKLVLKKMVLTIMTWSWHTWHVLKNLTWSWKHDMIQKTWHGLEKITWSRQTWSCHGLNFILNIPTHGLRLTLNLVCTRPSLYQCNKSLYQNSVSLNTLYQCSKSLYQNC